MDKVSALNVPPLHFVVPVWGEKYVRLFLDVTLPTFLSPRNIPCLPGLYRCAFHIFTMPDMVETIRSAPSFQALSALLPSHIHCFDGFDANKYNQMSWGHLRGMALANEAEAATVFLNADMVFSDGSFESIARILASGKRVIEIEGVRTNKPGMVEALRGRHFDPATQAITVPPDRLVRLMIDNLHKMSLSHFWEPEDDQGFMPFHTYFRVGRSGLIARSTHLYPFVVHPRNRVPVDQITTIDWDLVDRVCPDPADSHVVTDSREILAAEMSDPDYYVKPWYARRDVEQYRDNFFRNTHCCSARHRDVLRYVINFYTGRDRGPDWTAVRRRVDAWYDAIVSTGPIDVAGLWGPPLARTVWQEAAARLQPRFSFLLPRKVHDLVGLTFRTRFRRSFSLYRDSARRLGGACGQAMTAAPRVLFKATEAEAGAWLREVDRLYAEAVRSSGIEAASNVEIDLGGIFYGTGWGDEDFLFGQGMRRLGPDNSATVHLRLQPGDYDVELYVYSAPEGGVKTIRLSAGGVPLEGEVEWVVDRYRCTGVLPRAVVQAAGGFVALTVTGEDPSRPWRADEPPQPSAFSFTRLLLRRRQDQSVEAAPAAPAPEAADAEAAALPVRRDSWSGPGVRRRVRMLVALWGEPYIRLFCQSCLPTLLAPGNLPALAARHDFDLVFLTAGADAPHFDAIPEYDALRRLAPVHLLPIDDILQEWWHPASNAYGIVLTRAFHKGVMAMGEAQLDTHFVFWNADFCASDGSFGHLANLLAHEDFNGILAPSLRVDEASIVPEMLKRRDGDQPVISIPSRPFTRLALDHLHPTVKGKTVTRRSDYVSTLANQFYWHVDDELLVARNYLLFMLCIRPERICNDLAAYCDYGFIPEMVPSGRIHTVADSDEMLLLELQNPDKETQYLKFVHPDVPMNPRDFQSYISEWSTAEHRANSRVLTLFRAGGKTYDMAEIQAMTDRFMDPLEEGLYPEPRWHNGHPYWTGTILGMGKSARTALPLSPHTEPLRALGIDFDLYAHAELYFGSRWRDRLSAMRTDKSVTMGELETRLRDMDAAYPDFFREAGLPHHPRHEVDLTDVFFGTGWAPVDRTGPAARRPVGPAGRAHILLKLQGGRILYSGKLYLDGPAEALARIRITVNGNAYFQQIYREGDALVVSFFLPRGVVDTCNGSVDIGIEATGGSGADMFGVPSPVAVRRLIVESLESVQSSCPVILPIMDAGKLDLARQFLDDFGEDGARSDVGRLLLTRYQVLKEKRAWTSADLDVALSGPAQADTAQGLKAIVGSIIRHERDYATASRILDRLSPACPEDGDLWASLSHTARRCGKPKLAMDALAHAVMLAEGRYLKANPDVAADLFAGRVAGAAEHYLGRGREEGREWPGFLPVSELAGHLYLRRYPDVADLVLTGKVAWAYDHYQHQGKAEGREWPDAAPAPAAAARADTVPA